ncbi:hypothetical protein EGH25_05510 [Haladaptatus sp. F3-133]|uniref:Uncharacterized protein n=1 Tax=Halorutilus salinus TaxID=2487751 RepID=A0A9Q4C3W6_9EURY|nr:hypothetical protein [Halorutilus salinus]
MDEVRLYGAPTTVADADEIGRWLNDRVDASVQVHDRFLADKDVARDLAQARVLSPYDPETGNTMTGIVRYEERALEDPSRAGGVIYDGYAVQRALYPYTTEADEETVDIVLIDRALGTWGGDGRWHKRVAVLGSPALVSVPGLYEAPAKPEEYYKEKSKYAMAGGIPPREYLETEVDGEFLVEDDPRTTDALKGYALTAYGYATTGEGFCDDERCRLYDAHRQKGVVRAQLREPEFCDDHAAVYGTEEV